MQAQRSLLKQPLFWLALCVAISLIVVAYPVYVIRPFRYQGARELAIALRVIEVTPFVEVLLLIAGLVLAVLAWRQTRRIAAKVAALTGALLILLLAGVSRINVYELLFHPLDAPTFSPASQAKLDGSEEVIAIRVGQTARAYPVRSISYHHIVNDVVDGVPIVATY